MTRAPLLHWAFFVLSLAYAWTMLFVARPSAGAALQGLILRREKEGQTNRWVTITAAEVESGATIPRHTNVIFHLPFDLQRTPRRTLFGEQSAEIRSWGYCFPETEDPGANLGKGLPGKVFLSEAERKWRKEREAEGRPTYSIYRPPQGKELSKTALQTIRHQLESFSAGMSCYIMTDRELPIGADRDGDGLNIQVEKHLRTDPARPDTDGDGIGDGLEALVLMTNPLVRDTDGDGLIEGLEDRNRNGRTDTGETDPLKRDTDGDGICDGFCRISDTKKVCKDYDGKDCVTLPYHRWQGEDKNLNGIRDAAETDPLKRDADGDGVQDEQEYFNCILERKTSC